MFASAASKVSSSVPVDLLAGQAGKTLFSQNEVLKHAKALNEVSPPVGHKASLDPALQYIAKESQNFKEAAPEDVDVEVDLFNAKSGDSDLKNVVVRILPKNVPEASEKSILVAAHVDSVFSAEGAGDDSSSVAVMLELARGVSQSAHGFKNSVIFLFNTGEEEGLNGAHSFITQHPWSSSVRMAVDLEAIGVGRPSVFNQDLFSSGNIKTITDFQVYTEVAALSGLDFAFTDSGAVYHTKNDKLDLLKPGSLQHLGENMLPFLLQVGSTSDLPK